MVGESVSGLIEHRSQNGSRGSGSWGLGWLRAKSENSPKKSKYGIHQLFQTNCAKLIREETPEMRNLRPSYSEDNGDDDDDDDSNHEPLLNAIKPKNWIQGARLCGYATLAIMTLNIVLAIVAGGLASAHSGNFTSATLYKGRCTTAKGASIGSHLIINILSTVLLAASSYCMQGLVAPTRNEIDRAHASRTWLHIGTNSMKNLRHLSLRRIVLWMILLVTSLPIHLIYNSAVFSTINVNEYAAVMASLDNPNIFQSATSPKYAGCWHNNTRMTLESFSTAYNYHQYKNLSIEECYGQYKELLTPGRGLLVFLAQYNGTVPRDHIFWAGTEGPLAFTDRNLPSWQESDVASWQDIFLPGSPWTVPAWNVTVPFNGSMVPSDQLEYMGYSDDFYLQGDLMQLYDILEDGTGNETAIRNDLRNSSLWNNATWASEVKVNQDGMVCNSFDRTEGQRLFKVDGCLAFQAEEGCELRFSPAICLIVIVCNAIKVVSMLLASKEDKGEVFLTVGDGIASFLSRPDPHTQGQCLLSRDNITQWSRPGWWARLIRRQYSPKTQSTISRVLPRRKRWWQAVSMHDWLITFLAYIGTAVAAGLWVWHGLELMRASTLPGASLSNLGFGTVNWSNMITPGPTYNYSTLSMILLSNVPQLFLSIAYFFYNRNLTIMVLASEYDRFATRHKPLRVSWPKGVQRSTYFLTLPYRYSLPLVGASILLHWLVSESVFYVLATWSTFNYNADYQLPADEAVLYSTCAWSPIAIVCAICVGFSMLVVAVLLGCRRMKSRIPIAGNCSAAISAVCHPPVDEKDSALRPVRWGEVSSADGVGEYGVDEYAHCSFSAGDVAEPNVVRLYS